MKYKEYLKQQNILTRKIKSLETKLYNVKKQFIKDNADYQIGDTVKIENVGDIVTAVIEDYEILKGGILKPKFLNLEGKKLYTFEPVILGLA